MNLFFTTMTSPVGMLTLVANEQGLAAILWENENPRRVRLGSLEPAPHHPATAGLLRRYPPNVFAAVRVHRDAFPKQGLEGAYHHPLRKDTHLLADRSANRTPASG